MAYGACGGTRAEDSSAASALAYWIGVAPGRPCPAHSGQWVRALRAFEQKEQTVALMEAAVG